MKIGRFVVANIFIILTFFVTLFSAIAGLFPIFVVFAFVFLIMLSTSLF